MSRRRPRWMIVAAVAATLVAGIGIGAHDDIGILIRADLKTSANQHIVHALDDGSTIELDSQSAVEFRYSVKERRVVLLRGQVYVAARPTDANEPRPFVVEARNGVTRALGTNFNVNALDKTVEVIAVRHRIAVSAEACSSSPAIVTLSPGQGVRYSRNGQIRHETIAPALGIAWRKGLVVIDRATLRDAGERLRRYSDRPIHLWSDRREKLRISGVFDADDVEGALTLIAREHGLRLRKLPLIGFVLS
ncbi:MAG: FecR family protein [Sphingobium sp.]